MPNSRIALHGLAPPYFMVCALFLAPTHGLCAFFRPLDSCLDSPLLARLSIHGLHFTVYVPSMNTNFFLKLFGGGGGAGPRISQQKSWDIPPKSSVSLGFEPSFLAPTPSRARPPPHAKISGAKSLGLGPFLLPEKGGTRSSLLFFLFRRAAKGIPRKRHGEEHPVNT